MKKIWKKLKPWICFFILAFIGTSIGALAIMTFYYYIVTR